MPDNSQHGEELSSQSAERVRLRRRENSLNPVAGDASLSVRVARGSTVALGSHGIFLVLQIAQLAILSRLLTPDDFGVVGMALAVTGFIRLFQDMGLTSATIQRRHINQSLVSALFFLNIAVGFGLMLLCWIAAPLAGWLFNDERVTLVIVTLALTMPMLALRAQHRAIVSRRMEFVTLNLGQLVSNAAGVLVACSTAWRTDLGYWSIVAGQLVTGAADVLFFWIASSWRPSIPKRGSGVRSAVDFGARIMLSNILGWMWKQSDNGLIGWRWGSENLGYYARAYSLLLVPLMLISGPVASAVIPALSRLQDEREKWADLFTRAARAVTALSALFATVLFVNADFIIDIALGPGWDKSTIIFAVLILSIVPSIAWELARYVFLSLGRSDVMLKYSLVAGPLHLVAFAIGLQYGAVGVAWSLVAVSWLLAVPILVVSARTASISSRRLIIDVAPPVAGFAAAVGAIPLLAGLDASPIIRALALATVASVLFIVGTAAVAAFCASWRSDINWAVNWVEQIIKKRAV
ncbi:lipopolysaccharide biosynthesis protein [Henriciella algicola]|uniref:Lipopolysaccharide biosynthesis protein n=1 Tax=Henriciella algicola TaxID=1608422 RepID=A0A399REX8_9PROT|nr:lipopolysaccharide biosynthesis protein [Henriciella algicola]RIJ29193.1 lipopolysaccharide biosynthesis protein [Henriciella algicola]